jgi:thiamine transport system substrate-binding protein
MKPTYWMILTILGALVLAACTGAPAAPTPTASGPLVLRVMTHDSFAISEEVIKTFESQHNAVVQILPSGDAGTALNKAILSKGNPIADVFYGVDNTFLSRALAQEIFEPYASPALADIPAEFRLDDQNQALPVDYGDVCPNYDISFFAGKGLNPPQNLEDLLKPEYKGMLVVENPATSSPGLAFLLATIGHFGENGYLDYWKGLVANDVLVVNDWNSAYYSEFSVHDGSRPLVISYSSSPPAEVIFADPPVDQAPTAVISGSGACIRQVEFAGILKGAQNVDLARQWIDFMLSPTFQEDLPLQMFVYPVNTKAKLPEQFTLYTTQPAETSRVDPQDIEANRERWIEAWTEIVLRQIK